MGPHRDQFSLPSFFTVYTTDIKYQSLFISVMGCISDGDENEYRTVVENFITWCEDNFLQLNVTKTKDLSRRKAPMTPVSTEAWVWMLWRTTNTRDGGRGPYKWAKGKRHYPWVTKGINTRHQHQQIFCYIINKNVQCNKNLDWLVGHNVLFQRVIESTRIGTRRKCPHKWHNFAHAQGRNILPTCTKGAAVLSLEVLS